MQSTNPASIMFLRMLISSLRELVTDPLAKTKPATPLIESLLMMCSIHA